MSRAAPVVRAPAAARGAPRARRHRRVAVRRPRRRDQHHAPAAPGAGRRGDPPRPRPLGRRDRRRPRSRRTRDAVAVSSYQGGHMEFFRYLVDRLRERGAGHVRVYGGGGGTIVPEEIARARRRCGVARIFSPEDGRALGLEGMIRAIARRVPRARRAARAGARARARSRPATPLAVARAITLARGARGEADAEAAALRAALAARRARRRGARSSASPAPAARASRASSTSSCCGCAAMHPDARDRRSCSSIPTRRRSGGALLGDRIRMNAIHGAARLRALARDAPRAPRALARRSATRCACCRPRASTSSWSRPRASARATPRSSTSSTSRST